MFSYSGVVEIVLKVCIFKINSEVSFINAYFKRQFSVNIILRFSTISHKFEKYLYIIDVHFSVVFSSLKCCLFCHFGASKLHYSE